MQWCVSWNSNIVINTRKNDFQQGVIYLSAWIQWLQYLLTWLYCLWAFDEVTYHGRSIRKKKLFTWSWWKPKTTEEVMEFQYALCVKRKVFLEEIHTFYYTHLFIVEIEGSYTPQCTYRGQQRSEMSRLPGHALNH